MNSNSPLIIACIWMSRLAYMNICWFILTMIGGVIFGFLPASVVVCVMLRRYLNGAARVRPSEIVMSFKSEFFHTNICGWIILLPTISLGWYSNYTIMNMDGVWALLGIAIAPLVGFGVILLIAAIFQMSFYCTDIKGSIQNALTLIVDSKWVMITVILLLIVTLVVGYVLPIITVFYLVTPAFFYGISMLWREKEELLT
ncbi:DUF624 domain-containing protein [Vibrio sp. TH_r3]|uniref:DUF624 domain-containing protein n=1 Tax=Vibrio sp. TH_r3 TaxID=3082084 RepID=UPI0029556770|nr:DUF624 domain-containing protein [Vibrio sp. TH_r3]MDV7105118.1 DUF624 domain-containing protein [Vibrio sp. TH_r3]